MSQFLSPVHGKMYDKIHRQDNWRMLLLNRFGDEVLKNSLAEGKEAVERGTLSEVIDLSNIHGWLSHQVELAEARFAEAIAALMERGVALQDLEDVLYEEGKQEASYIDGRPIEVYQAVSWMLLDGMPCDFVNRVSREDDEICVIERMQDVHAPFWQAVGAAPDLYYSLRDAWVRGWLSAAPFEWERHSAHETVVKKVK